MGGWVMGFVGRVAVVLIKNQCGTSRCARQQQIKQTKTICSPLRSHSQPLPLASRSSIRISNKFSFGQTLITFSSLLSVFYFFAFLPLTLSRGRLSIPDVPPNPQLPPPSLAAGRALIASLFPSAASCFVPATSCSS